MRTIKVVYTDMIDVGCYSHTIDLVGDKLCTPTLDSIIARHTARNQRGVDQGSPSYKELCMTIINQEDGSCTQDILYKKI